MLAKKEYKKISTSVLDILINSNSNNSNKQSSSSHSVYLDLCESVRREVENLLNTQAPFLTIPEEFSEVTNSILNYGIPDFTTHSFSSEKEQLQLCKIIEEKIQKFEPRFKTVNVYLKSNDSSKDRTVRFRIEGIIYANPVPESIILDSHMQTETGSFSVFYDD